MNKATMSKTMRINSDHDAKTSFWPASGSLVTLDGAHEYMISSCVHTVWIGLGGDFAFCRKYQSMQGQMRMERGLLRIWCKAPATKVAMVY